MRVTYKQGSIGEIAYWAQRILPENIISITSDSIWYRTDIQDRSNVPDDCLALVEKVEAYFGMDCFLERADARNYHLIFKSPSGKPLAQVDIYHHSSLEWCVGGVTHVLSAALKELR